MLSRFMFKGRESEPTLAEGSRLPLEAGRPVELPLPDGQAVTVELADEQRLGLRRDNLELFLSHPSTGAELPIRPGESVLVGNSAAADFEIRDEFISRRHLQITNELGLAVLEDLGSLNGTSLLVPGKARLESSMPVESPAPAAAEQPPDFRQATMLKQLTPQRRLEILHATEIHADRETVVTPERLRRAGLEPVIETRLGKVSVAISTPFEYQGGRPAAMLYVTKEGRTVARPYYRSNSQALWRHPEFIAPNGWLGKGYAEDSMNAPFDLQKQLSLLAEVGVLERSPERTACWEGSVREAIWRDPEWSYPLEVKESHLSAELFGPFYGESVTKWPDPRRMEFYRADDNPDFQKVLDTWPIDSDQYGRLAAEVFESQNGRYRFLMLRNEQDEGWLAAVETRSQLTSHALRRTWVKAGDLVRPRFEYPSQADPRYVSGIAANGYVDMYQKFHARIPLNRQYVASWRRR